jgi:hypothetical protein
LRYQDAQERVLWQADSLNPLDQASLPQVEGGEFTLNLEVKASDQVSSPQIVDLQTKLQETLPVLSDQSLTLAVTTIRTDQIIVPPPTTEIEGE